MNLFYKLCHTEISLYLLKIGVIFGMSYVLLRDSLLFSLPCCAFQAINPLSFGVPSNTDMITYKNTRVTTAKNL